jgi:predicted transcriptional regulator
MANKAIIEVNSYGSYQQRGLDVARRFDAGEPVPAADYHLVFPSMASLFAELPPKRLQTLDALKAMGPASIYALAKKLGRNYSNVHRDIERLLEHSLVARDETNRVFVPWSAVEIHLASEPAMAA